MATPRVVHPICPRDGCGRKLVYGDRTAGCRLPAEDFCRSCARPISDKGNRLSDNAGFVRWAKNFTGRRPAPRANHALPEAL